MMGKNSNDHFSHGGVALLGLIIGIVLTFLYVKHGFVLPSWLQPVEKAKIFFITTTASLSADENDLNELQREIAVKMKESPAYYTRIDDSLEKFITEEIIWRDRTKRSLKLLWDYINNLDRFSATRTDGVARSIQSVLRALPQQTKEEKKLVYKYLKRRFPESSDSEIIEELKRISLADLFQMPFPSTRIVFALPVQSSVRIEIYDVSKQKVKTLIDAVLPSGQYRLYWDFSNEDGKRLSSAKLYSYEIYINKKKKRAEVIEVPAVLWE